MVVFEDGQFELGPFPDELGHGDHPQVQVQVQRTKQNSVLTGIPVRVTGGMHGLSTTAADV